MKKNPLLISSSAKDSIRDSVLLAQKLNTGIEISRVPLYKNDKLTVENVIEKLKSDLDGFEGRKTLHGMFSDVNISSSDVLLRRISRQRCIESFQIGKAIGADTILFHTGNKGTKHYGSINNFKKNYISFWQEFIQEFEKADIIAVAENVFETEPQFCIDLFEGINSPNFKLAIDTGHINLYAKETKVQDWIKAYGNKTHHMHLHNNFGNNDDHSNLANGTLNFIEIFDCIKENNITPSFVFEMYSEEDILKSMEMFKRDLYT